MTRCSLDELPDRAAHRLGVRATRARMAEMAAANLIAGVLGRPLPTPVVPPA
jgi:hypothetical protein